MRAWRARNAAEEHARNDDIGVEYNPHRDRRTLETALATSARRRPARFAASRARATSDVNSPSAGGSRTLKITTSRSATTTNCAPAFSPNRVRISSGMTTCPFEDRVVVAASIVGSSGMSYQ